MSTTTKTREQDWQAQFRFLHRPLLAPFERILQHAGSVKHLETMLDEWLPDSWQLSRANRIALINHWKQWYREHADKGAQRRDHLVQPSVLRDANPEQFGVAKHYVCDLVSGVEELDPSIAWAVRTNSSGRPEYSYLPEIPVRLDGFSPVVRASFYLVETEEDVRTFGVVVHLRYLDEEAAHRLRGRIVGEWRVHSVGVARSWHKFDERDQYHGVYLNLAHPLDFGELNEVIDANSFFDFVDKATFLEEVLRQLNMSGWKVS